MKSCILLVTLHFCCLFVWFDLVTGDKMFIADRLASRILVGENNGPTFVGSAFEEVTLSDVMLPLGIDFDPRNNTIYWTDLVKQTLNRATLDGSFQEELLQTYPFISFPTAIVLDLIENQMFWTDTITETIEVANLDGSNRRTVVSNGLYIPYSITLSQKRRKLIWCDESTIHPKIEMSNKDGSERVQLVTTNIREPNSLVLDNSEQRVYWTESFYDRIESIDLDDISDRRVHFSVEADDTVIFAISLYFNRIYFSEINNGGVYEVATDGVGNNTVALISSPGFLRIYTDLTCPNPSVCPGQSRCQLESFDTPGCTCNFGYTGISCDQEIICTLPQAPPSASFVAPKATYRAGESVSVACNNGRDQVTWVCNDVTGGWDQMALDCSRPEKKDKIFITDAIDGKILYGESNKGSFFGSELQSLTVTGLRTPLGIDYDYRNDVVYWTDAEERTINRAALDGSFQEVILVVDDSIGAPHGMVLDLMENQMFWTDVHRETIEASNLDGSNRRIIIDTDLYLPWSIVLSRKRGKIIWTDESNVLPKIEMSDKDGSNRIQLINKNVSEPNCLALDSSEQRLFWTESSYDRIESVDLDNLNDRKVHFISYGDVVVFGISLYYDSIYFTDYSSEGVYEIGVDKGYFRAVGFHVAPSFIHIYYDTTCPDPNPCPANRECELVAYRTPRCTCDGGSICDEAPSTPPGIDVSVCMLPQPPQFGRFETQQSVFQVGETLDVACINAENRVTWTCMGQNGAWNQPTLNCRNTNETRSAGLPRGATIGIVIAAIVILVLVVAAAALYTYFCKRRSQAPDQETLGGSQLSKL